MEQDDLETFKSLLAELFGAIDKPLTEAKVSAFWKGLAHMSLTEFIRTQELLIGEMTDSAASKTFTVHDVWQARRRLRATRPQEAAAAPTWRGDKWDEAANRHFFAFVLRRGLAHDPILEEHLKVLLEAKRAWAALMREEAGADGTVDGPTKLAMWNSCMLTAHDLIGRPYLPTLMPAFARDVTMAKEPEVLVI